MVSCAGVPVGTGLGVGAGVAVGVAVGLGVGEAVGAGVAAGAGVVAGGILGGGVFAGAGAAAQAVSSDRTSKVAVILLNMVSILSKTHLSTHYRYFVIYWLWGRSKFSPPPISSKEVAYESAKNCYLAA